LIFTAFLTFYQQYQRTPALATQDVDIPYLMKILREKSNLSTAAASSSNSNTSDEFNEELLP
jgi:hypothetical protein